MNNRFLVVFLLIQISLFGCAVTNANDLIRQQRIDESPQWNGESFQNPEQAPDVEWWPSLKMFWSYFFNKSEGFIPDSPLHAESFDIFPVAWTTRLAINLAGTHNLLYKD